MGFKYIFTSNRYLCLTDTPPPTSPINPLSLVYTGRVTRPSEMGPVTRASHSTLPLFLCCCSHDTFCTGLVLVSRMSSLRTKWRSQRVPELYISLDHSLSFCELSKLYASLLVLALTSIFLYKPDTLS